MAKISYFRAFDIQRQFYFGDWSEASISATATSVTLRLGEARIVLAGNFTLSGTTPVAGTISSLTYATGIATPVNEFAVSGLSLSYGGFLQAMGDGDFDAVYGTGHDWATGTTGNDRLYGYAGNDRLEAQAGNDTLFGSFGDDILDGGAGNDSLQGGSGNDTYILDSLSDRIVEFADAGTDSVRTGLSAYTLGNHLENLSFTGIANATGTGNALANVIIGNRGHDRLSGLDGNDTLSGGNGNDTLDGGNGDDFLAGDAGASAVTTSASGVSPSNAALPLTLSMTMAEVSATSATTVTGYINNASQGTSRFNLAFVIDVSGSMSSPFTGANIGDVNNDGQANEKVDAAIASFNALVNSLEAAGLSDMVRISLIPFSDSSSILGVGTPTSDTNGNGVADLIDAALTLNNGGNTNYGAGLNRAIEFFNGAPRGDNFVFFVSDGQPTDSYSSQLNTLRDTAGINATIRSLGIEAGTGGYLNVLDLLDDGLANNSAIDVKSPASLTAGLLSSQVRTADIRQLEIYKNGVLHTTLSPAQLTDTPFGLKYSVTINGLSSTASDTIETRLVLNDGASTYISTSQQISVGTLASNDSLVGGAGNDTLDGGAGSDTLAGGLGNDTYHVETTGKLIQELANQGTDTVETTRTYSLNTTALQYVENLVLLGSGHLNATGNANGNRIEGNLGNNVLEGLGGSDTLVGGYGTDIASYANSTQAVQVKLNLGTATATGKADQLLGIEGAWGSNYSDSLVGDAGNNIFRGNGGYDTISGGGGLDTVDYSAATAAMTVNLSNTNVLGIGNYGVATSADGSQGTDYILYSDVEGIIGSAFGDRITDAHGLNNRFEGGAGNDTLNGGNGNDTLIGGDGRDLLDGGAGTLDVIDYSRSAVAVSGSLTAGQFTVGTTGTDIDTVSGVEQVIGTGFADSIAGSLQNDSLFGGAGNDTLAGDAGNDTLRGGTGNDSLVGGAGDDVFYVDALGDVLVESAAGGLDTAYFDVAAGAFTRNLGEVENAHLAGGADFNITGGTVQNRINGGAGGDTINGGFGAEADTLSGGEGVDWVSYAGHLTGVRGTLNSSSATTLLGSDATSGFENFLGSSFSDVVTGDGFANILNGSAGADSLYGGSGNDTLLGGADTDLLDGDYGVDTVTYAHLGTAITVNLSTGVVSAGTDGADTLVEIECVVGGSGADSIGWVGSNYSYTDFYLDGGAGNDTLKGSYGDDTLAGGAGNDVLHGGDNTSTSYVDMADYSGAAAAVVVNLSTGVATGGAGTDSLTNIEGAIGSRHADTLTGSTLRAESFIGGAGADILDGGLDAYVDRFIYSSISDSNGTGMDTIRNFVSSGSYLDRIDLSGIDANLIDSNTNSVFVFLGQSAFSGDAGQLRFAHTATDTLVYADLNGDRVADMSIKLLGVHALTAASFAL